MEYVNTDDALARIWLHAARGFVERPLDEAINALLATLGLFHGADRAWVMRYSEDLLYLSNSHEWTREGVPPFVDELQKIPAGMLGSLHEDMLRDAVAYFDVIKMPVRLRLLQEEFLRQGNRSVLCLPLRDKGRLVGMFGYDAVRSCVRWPEPVIRVLRDAAGLIAAALARSMTRSPAGEGDSDGAGAVFVTQGGARFALPCQSIVLIEAEGDYTRLEIEGGTVPLQSRLLAEWERTLPKARFLRVHRSFLVNRSCIRELNTLRDGRWALRLAGRAEAVPVGRQYRAAVRSCLAVGIA
jgi:Response regulator of the LytR/AlgR family